QQNPVVNNIAMSGAGWYYVTVTDGSGCSGVDSVQVVVNAVPVVAVWSNSPVCEGDTLILMSQPNGMSSYSWMGPNGFTSVQQDPVVSNVTLSGAGWYYVTVTDGSGCSGVDSVQVVVSANPVVMVWSNSPVCEGDTLNLFSQPNGMNSYSWVGPNGYISTQQNPVISNVSMGNGGTYTVTVVDGNGCEGTGVVDVVISSPPMASISGDLEICEGESTVLTAGGGSPYEWLHNGSNSQSVVVSPVQTTSYSVVVGSGSCSDTAVVTVVVNSNPQADAWPDTVIVLGQSVTLNAAGGVNYEWSPATGLSCVVCGNPEARPEETTDYCVEVTDGKGCRDTACVRVVVELKCGEVYVPNVFSPNGDGRNDELRVYGNCIETLEFALYDRWGEKVFETRDPKQTWDGVYRGKAMNGAVFHYRLRATLKDGSVVEQKGTVTVVR
ncbi:MAG: gliding motility-associated C-terminal domain-containing protein, partial [Candidatus Pacearchaeota archaeon]